MFQRIECYRDMFLSQTQILTLQPLVALTKEFEKAKVRLLYYGWSISFSGQGWLVGGSTYQG